METMGGGEKGGGKKAAHSQEEGEEKPRGEELCVDEKEVETTKKKGRSRKIRLLDTRGGKKAQRFSPLGGVVCFGEGWVGSERNEKLEEKLYREKKGCIFAKRKLTPLKYKKPTQRSRPRKKPPTNPEKEKKKLTPNPDKDP